MVLQSRYPVCDCEIENHTCVSSNHALNLFILPYRIGVVCVKGLEGDKQCLELLFDLRTLGELDRGFDTSDGLLP